MTYLIYILIVFLATFLGASAGLGGGVIIKPALDFIGAHDLHTISILSSCAVFTMALYSTLKQIQNKIKIDYLLILLISVGAIIGGYIGNYVFELVLFTTDSKTVGFIQSTSLILLLSIVLLNVNIKLKTFKITNKFIILIIGLILGTISSFLSIGGGPINVAVFTFFFSINVKTATIYSIACILFSQSSKLISILLNDGFVRFDFTLLFTIIPTAILGGIVGTKLNKLASEAIIRTIFNCTVFSIILLNVYNIIVLVF